jgi:hypothetical protein
MFSLQRLKIQGISCGICGGQSRVGVAFSLYFIFFSLPVIISVLFSVIFLKKIDSGMHSDL